MAQRIISDYLGIELGIYSPILARVAILGTNLSVNVASVPVDIWPLGGTYPWKPSATIMEVLSSSALDTSAGTGARTIKINGLNAAYVEVSETVILNGVTPVATVNSYLRINVCSVVTAGSGETNAGDIDVRDSGGGTVRDRLLATKGVSQKAVFTVPAGKILHATSLFTSINLTSSARWATVGLYIRTNLAVSAIPRNFSVSDQVPYTHRGAMPIPIQEKSDVALRVLAVSKDITSISGEIEAFLSTTGTIFF